MGHDPKNIAIAQQAIATHATCTNPRPPLTAALAAAEAALTVYDPVHLSYYHAKATALRDGIQAQLNTLPPA